MKFRNRSRLLLDGELVDATREEYETVTGEEPTALEERYAQEEDRQAVAAAARRLLVIAGRVIGPGEAETLELVEATEDDSIGLAIAGYMFWGLGTGGRADG